MLIDYVHRARNTKCILYLSYLYCTLYAVNYSLIRRRMEMLTQPGNTLHRTVDCFTR